MLKFQYDMFVAVEKKTDEVLAKKRMTLKDFCTAEAVTFVTAVRKKHPGKVFSIWFCTKEG